MRAGVALLAVAAALITGCAGPSASPAKTATSLADFGTLDDLVKAAQEEGTLNIIACPRTWANYGAIIDGFKAKYNIEVNEQNPDGSSADEIAAAKTNAGLDTAPDVFDLGLAVAVENKAMFAPYKVATWDDIPDGDKEASGLHVSDYGGYMALGFDSSKLPEPASLDDLLKADYKGVVAINGDPTQAGSALNAVALATVQSGGTLDDFTPGIEFFGKLQAAGNFLKVDPTDATIATGETPMVFDWDYLSASQGKDIPGWKVILFPGKGVTSYYQQAINADAPHPAAARLWEEYLFSDEGQNLWLEGGARPVRMAAMTSAGTINAEAAAGLPAVPAEALTMTPEQSSAAGTLLGEKWSAAVG
jgi:putative spermidine/putrescine transport system substrate-binding protein